MLVLGLPVMDGHELTSQFCEALAETIAEPQGFRLVVIDNNSTEHYSGLEFKSMPFAVDVVRHEKNVGYYRPILDLARWATSADLVGLVHNDLFFYSEGWDTWVRQCFVNKSDLGMIGVCGSNELDDRGGRGGGTMCNFRGEKGARTEDTGARVVSLAPAIILDSMLMITRQSLVPQLKVDENTPICHFMDKVWPLRLHQAGYSTAVLGIEVDHMGGQTAVANPRFLEACAEWCAERGVETDDPGGEVYRDAEQRLLGPYRPALIPSHMQGWELVRGS